MSRARAAAARAKMHEAIDELFDALEERAANTDRDSEARPVVQPTKKRAAPPKPKLVRPAGENDELASAKARRFLRQNGLAQVNR